MTDLPTSIVVVNGENVLPGMETVGVPSPDGSVDVVASLLQPAMTINKSERTKVFIKTAVLLGLAIMLSASVSSAQTCLGLPSFAVGKAHVNASVDVQDSATAYAAGLGAGTPNSLFATIGGGLVKYQGYQSNSKFGFLEFGYQVPVARLQVCPVAGGSFGVGPDDNGFKVTSRSAAAGGAVGMQLGMLIPNASVRYNYFSDKVEEQGIGSETTTSNATIADLGLSLVVKSRFVVQPIVHVPLSGGDKTSWGVFLALAF